MKRIILAFALFVCINSIAQDQYHAKNSSASPEQENSFVAIVIPSGDALEM